MAMNNPGGMAGALNPFLGGPMSQSTQTPMQSQEQPMRMQWGGGGNPQGGISFGGNFGGQQYGGRQQMRPMMRPAQQSDAMQSDPSMSMGTGTRPQYQQMPMPGTSPNQQVDPPMDSNPNASGNWGGGMPQSNAMQGMAPDQQAPSERPEMMGRHFGMQFGGAQPGQQGMRFGGGMGAPQQQGMQFGGNFGGRQMRQY